MDATSSDAGDRSVPLPQVIIDAFATLGPLAEGQRSRCLALATAGIRRLQLDGAGVTPDDAVNGALLLLCQRIRIGTTPAITTSEAFITAFPSILKQFLVDQWRRYHAQKRDRLTGMGGGGNSIRVPDIGLLDAALDVVDGMPFGRTTT